MERLIVKKLEGWKLSPIRKPLIVRGARQVGKSHTITEFGKTSFKGRIHVVDFEKRPDWKTVFDKNLDPFRIVNELEVLLNVKITKGEDLLFLDEIQAAPKAIMSLRYFHEEMPELHVIAAGSLLEFELKNISFPVGRVNLITMVPMNFYEFLKGAGMDKLAEIIASPPAILPDSIHNKLIDVLRQYLFIGGMPECVKVWLHSKSIADVFTIQSDLINTYRQDFSKYAPHADKRSLSHALSSVVRNIGHTIKYTNLSNEFTGPTNKKAFDLLNLARIIHKIHAASPASLPLHATASEKKFKAILVDTGLMRSLSELPATIEYPKNDLLNMYQGALAEQFAGQEFISGGVENLYYWSREAKNSSAEVDYMIVRNNTVCPVEIKGGAAGKLRSMHLLLQHNPHIEKGYVLSTNVYGELPEQRLVFLPLYYSWWLANDMNSGISNESIFK